MLLSNSIERICPLLASADIHLADLSKTCHIRTNPCLCNCHRRHVLDKSVRKDQTRICLQHLDMSLSNGFVLDIMSVGGKRRHGFVRMCMACLRQILNKSARWSLVLTVLALLWIAAIFCELFANKYFSSFASRTLDPLVRALLAADRKGHWSSAS